MNTLVLWKCLTCGNEWKGKSPYIREKRLVCPECSSRNVKVNNWLFDKEKWKNVRVIAFKRAKWQCEVCNKKLNSSSPVHHLNYDDYYNPDNLVCLCKQCHHLVHGDRSFKIGRVLRSVGLIAIVMGTFLEWWILPNPKLQSILRLFLIIIAVGIGFIFLSHELTKKTRKVRRKIKKVVKTRYKHEEFTSGEDELTHGEEEPFHCQECGRQLSDAEYWEFGGLCNRCRGMSLQ